MKKIGFLIMLFVSTMAYAQDAIQMQFTNGDIIPNAARLYKYGGASPKVIHSDSIIVKNISNDVLRLKVRKTILFSTDFTSDSYYALSQYVAAGESMTPNYYALDPDEVLDNANAFNGQLRKTSTIEMSVGALVRYSFLSVDANGDILDSVYVDYAYSSSSLLSLDEFGQPNIYSELLITAEVDTIHTYPVQLRSYAEEVPVRVSKNVEAQVDDEYEFYFKFNGVTYAPTDNFDNGAGVPIALGDTLNGENGFVAYFNPNNKLSDEMPKVSYTFFNKLLGSNVDAIKLSFLYNISGIGFAEHHTYNISKPYPNPAFSYFYIDMQLPKAKVIEIKLYNVAGQLIQRLPIDDYSGRVYVSTTHLKAGMYFVNVEVDGKSIGVEKLMIN